MTFPNIPIRKYHVDGTLPENGEIFVYGSNVQGIHGKGSAKIARFKYGAKLLKGEGLQGQSYGVPTRWYHFDTKQVTSLDLMTIRDHVRSFCEFTYDRPDLKFFVVAVGCTNAGYTAADIAPLFKNAINCSFPEEWREYLED